MQLPGEDNDYWYTFAKLRNSNTAAVSKTFRYASFNQGMFLDIFVLDNVMTDNIDNDFDALKTLILENSTNMRRNNPYPSERDFQRIKQFKPRSPRLVWNEINALTQKYDNKKTEKCIVSGMTIYKASHLIYDWKDLTDLVDCNIYNHNFLIPRNYDKVLTTTYGDYMKFPPVEERGTWHDGVIFDPTKSYLEVLDELRSADLKH